MKNLFLPTTVVAMLVVFLLSFSGCKKDQDQSPDLSAKKLNDIALKLKDAGFDTSEGFYKFKDGGYIVEYDIHLTEKQIDNLSVRKPVGAITGRIDHYRTNNLVSGTPRTLYVYMDSGFDSYMQSSFDIALSRYNNLGLKLSFQRVYNSSDADISIFSFYEQSSTLGYSAGFPDNNGNPASPINLNTYYYNGSSHRADAPTVIAHEIGHAIGFRHTDFARRSFSCGGSGGNEGSAGIGAVHIPGTPTAPSSGSWMLACSSGRDRPFTSADQTALFNLYGY